MQKRRRKNPPKGRPSDVALDAAKGGTAQRPPYPERSPGEHRYKDINHRLHIARIAKGLKFAQPPTPLSPAWQDLMAYLKPFWGSPHEAEIWDLYKRFTRVDPKYQTDIEGPPAGGGMAAQDWIAKGALAEIRRHVRLRPPLLAILTAAVAESDATLRLIHKKRPHVIKADFGIFKTIFVDGPRKRAEAEAAAAKREADAKAKADTPPWITRAAEVAAVEVRKARGKTVKIPALARLCEGRNALGHMTAATFTKNVVPVLLNMGLQSRRGAAGGLFDLSTSMP